MSYRRSYMRATPFLTGLAFAFIVKKLKENKIHFSQVNTSSTIEFDRSIKIVFNRFFYFFILGNRLLRNVYYDGDLRMGSIVRGDILHTRQTLLSVGTSIIRCPKSLHVVRIGWMDSYLPFYYGLW